MRHPPHRLPRCRLISKNCWAEKKGAPLFPGEFVQSSARTENSWVSAARAFAFNAAKSSASAGRCAGSVGSSMGVSCSCRSFHPLMMDHMQAVAQSTVQGWPILYVQGVRTVLQMLWLRLS